MSSEEFQGRYVEVIDFDDVSSGEHVIEFRAIQEYGNGAVVAVSVPDEGAWEDAMFSINPHVGDVPVSFVIWALQIAKTRI